MAAETPLDAATRVAEAEESPAMEVHLGEVHETVPGTRGRVCIIWLNGRRWQGTLRLQPPGA